MKKSSLSFAVFLVLVTWSVAVASTVQVGRWQPVFRGIDQSSGTIEGQGRSIAYAMRVNLRAPGVSFYTTPHQGQLNTVSMTTTQFLLKYGLQVAINANFFSPCCFAVPERKTVLGLSVSDGNLVAPPVNTPGQNISLLINRKNQAKISETSSNTDLSDVFNAVTGSGVIVRDGLNVGDQTPYGDGARPNPRTAVGLSKDGQYLYLVVIDGRHPEYSVGTTHAETAEIMIAFGCYQAVNLDGGGSTELVKEDGHGGVTILNRPSGGTERYLANQLGIRALPLRSSSHHFWPWRK